MDKVELQLAFTWTCHDCNGENVTPAAVLAARPDSELAEELDLEDLPEEFRAGAVMAPRVVECTYCRAEFETSDVTGADLIDEDDLEDDDLEDDDDAPWRPSDN